MSPSLGMERVLPTANAARTNGLTCLRNHEILVTNQLNEICERCLTSMIYTMP
jgi:hypothetical protein